ncbi:hypothetical protein Gotri_019041 [Gossypium trilobum]|uniref:DUF4283 domain-containing protein n=1 Tax=Gossypium trilobum TaxID=34281 RepID=A0A7J9EBI5_9ROSI|nr:hypothetical protein [Gossypium trilobum]
MITHEFNKNVNYLVGVVGRSVKKVWRRLAESPDLDSDDPVADVNDMSVDSERVISWKDKLIGNQSMTVISEDEFELLDGNVTKEIVDGILSITFSDRIIFGHYLTVRPWTPSFLTGQLQPQSLLVWIRLPGLPEGTYSKSLLKFICGVIGLVAKVDKNTENNSKGQFAPLVVYIDLGKPLVSKINIDGRIQ